MLEIFYAKEFSKIKMLKVLHLFYIIIQSFLFLMVQVINYELLNESEWPTWEPMWKDEEGSWVNGFWENPFPHIGDKLSEKLFLRVKQRAIAHAKELLDQLHFFHIVASLS